MISDLQNNKLLAVFSSRVLLDKKMRQTDRQTEKSFLDGNSPSVLYTRGAGQLPFLLNMIGATAFSWGGGLYSERLA